MLIVDGHLDLSDNALHGRKVELPARRQQADSTGIATVGLPDLRAGGVALIGAAMFYRAWSEEKPGYRTPDEAHAMMQANLRWYQEQESAGRMRLVRNRRELTEISASSPITRGILLMEGADAIRDEQDLQQLFDCGLRIVGLAWRQTRYAHGADSDGPLSAEGISMVRAMDRFGIILDASHLAEESFWQLAEISSGPMIASHSNCRAIVPTPRQLSDAMIRAIAQRGGVIGINFYDLFLLPPNQYGNRRATLEDVLHHIRHICDLLGNARHIGLGTDMDGGLGREQIPVEIETSADLPKLAEALSAAKFSDQDVAAIMGQNWLRFYRENLAEE